jgi:hypothetical protein
MINYLKIRDMQILYVIRQNNSPLTQEHTNIKINSIIYTVLREYFVMTMIIESLSM